MPFVDVEGRIPVLEFAPDFTQRHQPIRLVIRQWLEQDAIDDREDRRGCANGQCQREDDSGGVAAVATDAAECVAKVEARKAHATF